MNNFKKLLWKNNLIQSRVTKEFIYLVSTVNCLQLNYTIRNYISIDSCDKLKRINEYHLTINKDEFICSTIEEAKSKAQEHFEDKVLKMFFI